jgi:predicted transposase/invertase (TIGR01784 family)
MSGKYINPYTDFGFKRIFGQEANKDILISFLNSLLPEKHQVADLRFLNTERTAQSLELHAPILDLICESPSGEQFIVEMQKKNQLFFLDRSVYYTACAIRDQMQRGEKRFALAAVYYIGIMDFVFKIDGCPPRLMHEISLKDQDGVKVYEKLHMYFIQMPLFDKTENQLETTFDKWLYFLKNLPDFDSVPDVFGEPVFAKAFENAERAAMTPEEHRVYMKTWDILVSSQGIIDFAVMEAVEAAEKAVAEKTAANTVKQTNLENARKMKELGVSAEIITQVTGLKENEF